MAGLRATALALLTSAVVAAPKPHVVLVLSDDYGWANLGVHRRGEEDAQARAEVQTPNMDALIDQGIALDRHYTYKICSPSRSSLQTGRLALHVNDRNTGVTSYNPKDPTSGYAAIPRNMTGVAEKLKSAGYRTHMVGKWDAGMATPDHSPKGRGYETWIGYYQHANDYWRKNTNIQAVGEIDNCLNRMADFSMHNETYCGPVTDAASLSDDCKDDPAGDSKCYEEYVFRERALQIVREHDASSPLFLFYSFHLLHTPLQIPLSYLAKIDDLVQKAGGQPFDSQNRRLYAAMVYYMDEAIGMLVNALQDKKMWDNTLMIFTSDNGGPVYEPGAANNHPLKGGKYSDWEGGIRTNAFVSGGFVPKEKRGSKHEGIVSIADWYGTLCNLAGVDMKDTRSEAANVILKQQGLPQLFPVESVDQWPHILGGTNGRPDPFHVSELALIQWPYKLVKGKQVFSRWQGPQYPNCSTIDGLYSDKGPLFGDLNVFSIHVPIADNEEDENRVTWIEDCGDGCLFNIQEDPSEHNNLAGDSVQAATLSAMQEKLADLNKHVFKPDRGSGKVEACFKSIEQGRMLGPFVDTEGFYSPRTPPSPEQQQQDDLLKKQLKIINLDVVERGAAAIASAVLPLFRDEFAHKVTRDVCFHKRGAAALSTPETEVAFV